MNIVVFGASGGTGLEVVKRALEGGHAVLAFVRDPSRLPFEHPRLKCCQGDVFDLKAVGGAVRGQDAVVCALGAKGLGKTTVRAEGTKTVVAAMQQQGTRRLVVVSTLGAGESWAQLSPFERVLFTSLLRHAKADHDRQEDAVRASELKWTIVRPGELTNHDRTGRYTFGTSSTIRNRRLPRADVADLVLKVIGEHTFIGQAVAVTGLRRSRASQPGS